MSFDLSWLWNLLNSLTSTLNAWFSGIWTQVSNIVNTGQGIFAGLVAFGSQIWDAITKFATAFGEWVAKGLDYIRIGLQNAYSTLGQWLNNALTFIAQGITWFGSQLYNLGNWLYNSMLYIWNWMVNTVTSLWNTLATWFSGMATAIQTWWTTVSSTINTWFSNIITVFRNKAIETIQTDLTISMAWKGAERILSPQKLSDVGYGFFGIFASPIVGRLVGVIIDAVIPIASSTPYPLVPTLTGFSYTPPPMTVTTPTEKPAPTPTVTGYPAGAFMGLSEDTKLIAKPTYDVNIMAGQDLSRQIVNLSYEVEVV